METTGLSCSFDHIIEFGAVVIERGEIKETKQLFVKPPVPINAFISEKTNITNEDVAQAKPFAEVAQELVDFIGDKVLVAHNATFDYNFLNEELKLSLIHILINRISSEILTFNQKNQLGLADYSLALLSAMLRFVRLRMTKKCRIRADWTLETQAFHYRQSVAADLKINDPLEAAYLTAFISSLTTLSAGEKQTIIDQGVTRLITCFESRMAVVIEDRETIRRSIAQHLLASYYRIQFQFPIRNFCLDEIKSR